MLARLPNMPAHNPLGGRVLSRWNRPWKRAAHGSSSFQRGQLLYTENWNMRWQYK